MDTPGYLTMDEMQRHFEGGPNLRKNAVFVLLGGRIYKRENDRWRLLDDRTYTSIEEMTVGS